MAPEALSHRIGFKSDVWSAGAMLYEMTYGRPPYFGISDRKRKAAAILSGTHISFPPQRDRRLVDCVKQCLQFDLKLRPNAYQLQTHSYTRM